MSSSTWILIYVSNSKSFLQFLKNNINKQKFIKNFNFFLILLKFVTYKHLSR
jgi:hypothetical protein